MKKLFIFALSVLASTSVFAYDHTFTVVNISKDNVDATQNQPRIGDMLLFRINFNGTTPVADEPVAVDVSNLKNAVTFTETTPGELRGNMIEFPNLNNSADLWEEEYGFYARINDTNVNNVSATFQGQTLTIPLNLSKETRCTDCPQEVPQTGPKELYLWILAAVAFFCGILGLKKFKQS